MTAFALSTYSELNGMTSFLRIGVAQLCSSDSTSANLKQAASLIQEASQRGCLLVCLPEAFAYVCEESSTRLQRGEVAASSDR